MCESTAGVYHVLSVFVVLSVFCGDGVSNDVSYEVLFALFL